MNGEPTARKLWFELSGLEFVRATIAGEVSFGSMADTMAIRAVAADIGYLRLEVRPDKRHLNPAGMVHGGYAATVLDMATGIVAQTTLSAGQTCVTVDLQVQMIKPLPLGHQCIAEGHITRRTRKLAFTRGELRDEAGDIYAHAQSTVMIIDAEEGLKR